MDLFTRQSQADGRRQQQLAATGQAAATAMTVQMAAIRAAAAAVGGAKEKFGYRVGDVVFYTRGGRTFESGNALVYGCEGEVTDVGGRNKLIGVTFPGNKKEVGCHISALSHTAPPTRIEMEENENKRQKLEQRTKQRADDAAAFPTPLPTRSAPSSERMTRPPLKRTTEQRRDAHEQRAR